MAVIVIAVLVATLAPRIRLGPLVPRRGLPIGGDYVAGFSSRGTQRPYAELRNS
jgi:hypothetical protein